MAVYITRTPAVGSPVEYESADTPGGRGQALADAWADFQDGDTYTLTAGTFEVPDTGGDNIVAIITSGTFTMNGVGFDDTIIRAAGNDNLLEFSGACIVNLSGFTITSGSAIALGGASGDFTGVCTAVSVAGDEVSNPINPSSGSGALNWTGGYILRSSPGFALDPTGLTTTLRNLTITATSECLDVADGAIVNVYNCDIGSSGAGESAILVGAGAIVRLRSGAVLSAADGLDIDNGAGGFVCVDQGFSYNPAKTSGVISECGGSAPPSGAIGAVGLPVGGALGIASWRKACEGRL